MVRRKTPRPESPSPDLDGARAVVRELADARRREKTARSRREDYIEAEHKRGVQPSKTAEALQAAADELALDKDTRRQFGVSEGSVHHALSRRGAKGAR